MGDFFKGYYEPEVTRLIKEVLNPGDVIVDIGANVGVHTLVMAKEVGNKGKVYAFEPHPEISKRLLSNINLNKFNNVKVSNNALSNNTGELDFFVHNPKRLHKGQSTFYKEHLDGEARKIKVEVDTLDNFAEKNKLKKINLIKIDTEGNDFKVLQGTEEVIKNFSPNLIFEFEKDSWALADNSFDDAYNFLKDKDYEIYKICKNRKLKKINNTNYSNSMMTFSKKMI